ncbi:type II secretion system protein [Paenibacillus sp. FSL P4-0338]|uniref:type II secretion system protein n=1 Tax=unclassified Paenibacillus TaxID=185978 RepID=UPI0003E21BC4|nr:type II secretion system protein [Paenibacillus sp. FSL R7-269]ETT50001.1 hypothetical protein C162_12221 [Paenibacillus sp. FSL R7-269]
MLAQAIRKRLGKAVKEEKGFTLIELLAVIVILGIIAVIAVPLIGNIINKSKEDSDLATARQIYDASRLYITAEKNGVFETVTINDGDTDKTNDLVHAGYLENPIYLPSNKESITGGAVTYTNGALTGVSITTSSHAGTTGSPAVTFTATQILTSKK